MDKYGAALADAAGVRYVIALNLDSNNYTLSYAAYILCDSFKVLWLYTPYALNYEATKIVYCGAGRIGLTP